MLHLLISIIFYTPMSVIENLCLFGEKQETKNKLDFERVRRGKRLKMTEKKMKKMNPFLSPFSNLSFVFLGQIQQKIYRLVC